MTADHIFAQVLRLLHSIALSHPFIVRNDGDKSLLHTGILCFFKRSRPIKCLNSGLVSASTSLCKAEC